VEKHARATVVDLVLCCSDGGIELTLRDNGSGLSGQYPDDRNGFGLLGIRERVELLGGRLHFGPDVAGAGVILKVFLPYSEEAE
jgi:signal transduction histidine kinase